ncbi:exodeoxyribonuclease VII large subunit [Neolewinella xylanilytica]|uniref:Exodeoxyribonuclease 7 large subunit n=1 Tax=Neolewinella xylanilytica TaxID=1514080 RepID=A0A2S6I098_9BACT|nr:exodeoxyribonuclease VII large subunit [Neolewinella xylanilytica]PPK84270.1 exodeoxyribonuclease VII large subunit [Neolewinella xylanilytica]
METLSLSQLTTFIRRVFALNLPEPVWITAELAQVSEARGHTWLTLVEKSDANDSIVAQMEAVIWSGGRKKLRKSHGAGLIKGLLQEGMSVRLRVTASFHERYGLKLVVEDVDPAHTIGALEQRRQATLTALNSDGLLDRNAARPLPPVIQRLAVISSETAAGLADFQRQLRDNPYGYVYRQEVYPAAMQGAQTTEEILTRLRQIKRRASEYDAIVIVRGGGGKTDLAAFDDELLCRAVADGPLPVLAGIGHEIDDTVLDRVVHRSLKTPTAVAAYLVDRSLRAEMRVLQIGRTLDGRVRQILQEERDRLERTLRLAYQSGQRSLNTAHLRTGALEERLHSLTASNLATAREKLDTNERLLTALRPETTLARGYALLVQEGKLVTTAKSLKTGDVEVRLQDGKAKLRKD